MQQPASPTRGGYGGGSPSAAGGDAAAATAVETPLRPSGATPTSASPGALATPGSSGLADEALLRAQHRRCEQELMERERQAWRGRIGSLEAECEELDVALRRQLAEGGTPRTETQDASVRAQALELYAEAEAAERDEAMLEAVVRERAQTSRLHASNASALQLKADSLQAVAARESEVAESLATELNALEACAVVEERRSAHEQRVQTLHLQVTEAATRDVRKSAEDLAASIRLEEQEDAAKHVADMRQLKAAGARRLRVLEEEELARSETRALQEARTRERSADARANAVLASLRNKHAAESRRFGAAREQLLSELAQLVEENDARAEELWVNEGEIASAESELRCAAEAAADAQSSATRLACQLAAAEQRVEARQRRAASPPSPAAPAPAPSRPWAADDAEDADLDLAGQRELAAAEAACSAASAAALARRSSELGAACAARDKVLSQLGGLRQALRRQHDEAEAAHAAALGDEAEAERLLQRLRLSG